MKLQFVYPKKADIPEGMADAYTEIDGKFNLNVEGVKTQEDIDKVLEATRKEREEHDATKKELKTAKTDLGTAQDKVKAFESGDGGSGGRKGDEPPTHEERVELSRLQRENETLTTENGDLKTKHEALSGEVTGTKVKAALRIEAAKVMRPDAVEHEVNAAAGSFVFADGKALTNPDLGAKGGIAPDAFFGQVLVDRPYLAAKSNSGGAGGGSGGNPSDSDKQESSKDFYDGVLSGKS